MAKKKNAPVLKNNLRNVPAEKFRAVNRMNGIVTMVEYTGEDDIKAYELEPTYRELGGEGGSSLKPILKLTLTEDSQNYEVPMYCIVDGEVMGEEQTIQAGETADILILNVGSNFIYVVTEDSSGLTYAITDLVNCTKLEHEGAVGLKVTDPSQNASATLKITGGL